MVLIILSLSSVFHSAYYPSDEEVARMVLDSNIGRSGQVEDHVICFLGNKALSAISISKGKVDTCILYHYCL